MHRVEVVTKSEEHVLVRECPFFLNHIGCSFGDWRKNMLDCSRVSKTTLVLDKQTCSDNTLKFASLIVYQAVNYYNGCLAFVLKVNYLFNNIILSIDLKRAMDCDLLFADEKHHGVKFWNTRHFERRPCPPATLAYCQIIGREWLKVAITFITEFQVVFVQGVLLEAN